VIATAVFDHTSPLKYLIDKWSLGPLGARAQAASSIAGLIQSATSADCLKSLPVSGPTGGQVASASGRPTLSAHQTALIAMTQLLESMTDVEASSLQGRVARMIVGFDGAVDVGMQRVEEFLSQSKC
jgi:hypothetical protein